MKITLNKDYSKVVTYHYPENWRPILGEYDKKKVYLLQHFDVIGKGVSARYIHTDSIWFETKELKDQFIIENGIQLSIHRGTKPILTPDGWMLDYL